MPKKPRANCPVLVEEFDEDGEFEFHVATAMRAMIEREIERDGGAS